MITKSRIVNTVTHGCLLALFSLAPLCAQASVVEVKTMRVAFNEKYGSGFYNFPYVVSENKALADKINTDLFSKIDLTPPDHFVETYTQASDTIQSLEFTVKENSDNFLNIEFEISGCAAYCLSYTVIGSYALDGSKLTDYFTKEGTAELIRQKNISFRRQYKTAILEMRNAGYDENAEDSSTNLAIDSYTSCGGLDNLTDRSLAPAHYTQDELNLGDNGEVVEMNSLGLSITVNGCLSYAIRGMDSSTNTSVHWAAHELAPYYSALGRKKFLINDLKNSAVPPLPYTPLEPVQIFPAPKIQNETQALAAQGWKINNTRPVEKNGWLALYCVDSCQLVSMDIVLSNESDPTNKNANSTLNVSWQPTKKQAGNNHNQPPETFEWKHVVALLNFNHLKKSDAKPLVTWLHRNQKNYPLENPERENIQINREGKGTLFVPRISNPNDQKIALFELRSGYKRQALAGYDQFLNRIQEALMWAGDIDGDGMPDLIMSHQANDSKLIIYLSSMAAEPASPTGELVGIAGSCLMNELNNKE